jgi:hypothetical protein
MSEAGATDAEIAEVFEAMRPIANEILEVLHAHDLSTFHGVIALRMARDYPLRLTDAATRKDMLVIDSLVDCILINETELSPGLTSTKRSGA